MASMLISWILLIGVVEPRGHRIGGYRDGPRGNLRHHRRQRRRQERRHDEWSSSSYSWHYDNEDTLTAKS